MKTILLTGGGTSGHVTPNIALIPGLKECGYSIHYIGSKKGLEKELIEKMNIIYHSINSGKLRRYTDIKNITDMFRILDGVRGALAVIKKIKPDIVFSKGGFVSCPVVWAAWICRIPVIIHESDMTPGLANRLSIPFARKICYAFPETKGNIPEGKGILTGIPIRKSLLNGDRDKGLELCGFSNIKPVVTVIGGSQGAQTINKTIRKALNRLLDNYQICHICGKGNMDPKFDRIVGYKQFEYVNEELPHLFSMTDLFISRAGATTLFEILSLRKPAILIPLTKMASRGDQILNAASFVKQGFSYVLPEEKLEEESLVSSVTKIYENRKKYISNMNGYKSIDTVDTIVQVIKDNLEYPHPQSLSRIRRGKMSNE